MRKQNIDLKLKEKIYQELYDMYKNKRLGIIAIAKHFNKSRSWVSWKLKQYEIPLWSQAEAMIKYPAKNGIKKCSVCLIDKDTKEFNKGNNQIDGLEYWCKKCRSNHHKKYLPAFIIKRREDKKKIVLYKGNKCARCGLENLPLACYVFHHLNREEKEFEIGNKITNNFEKIKEELDKCILVCWNCHQIIHFGDKTASDC